MTRFLGINVGVWGDSIAFSFALAAIILCGLQIRHHIYHNHYPHTRRYIIRILLMVVVYSINSWIGLWTPNYSIYLDAIRDSYEALVIYSFYQLLIQTLGGEDEVQSWLILITEPAMDHVWPCNYCCKPWPFANPDTSHRGVRLEAGPFFRNCSAGVIQYCFIQMGSAIATFVMQLTGVYGEGSFNLNVGYPYVATIRSASQTWAIYCLVLFYLALKQQSHESEGYQTFTQMRPVGKFLCIKGVVFFTYWQSIVLATLFWLGVLKAEDSQSADSLSVALQDFAICIEMFLFAIAHMIAFRVDDFRECGYAPLLAPHHVILDVANVTDVVRDGVQQATESQFAANVKTKIKDRKKRKKKKAKRRQRTVVKLGAITPKKTPSRTESTPTVSHIGLDDSDSDSWLEEHLFDDDLSDDNKPGQSEAVKDYRRGEAARRHHGGIDGKAQMLLQRQLTEDEAL